MKNRFFLVIFFLVIFLLAIFIASPASAQNYSSESTLPGAVKESSAELVQAEKEGWQTVVIVYKTHFDIGYSERIQQVLHDYRTAMADQVLAAIDQYAGQPKDKQFVWTLSGWPMKQIIADGQPPERRKKIEQAIESGNLAIHAYPFTLHTETSELEDMVRGLGISSEIARKFGRPLSVSAKATDVPGHSWIIPTLFTHAGIKFYHMGGPVVNFSQDLPPVFWWEGPDGSRLLTFYTNDYGTPQAPPPNWPYKTWLYISMTGDNQGPPHPQTVANHIDSYKNQGINAVVGSMDDFAELLLQEDLSALPVVRTDVSDVWIHGVMSQPAASKTAMNIRPSIAALDTLTTLERIWGIYRPDISRSIADAYENSQLFSEHTWGLANQHYVRTPYGQAWQELWERGLPAQFRLMEASWKDKAESVEKIEKLIDFPYRDAVSTLADNVKVDGGRIVVFNPLPWTRDGMIEFDTRLIFGNGYQAIKPLDGGAAIPVSHEYPAIEDGAPMSRFVVKDIPPLGYRTFVPAGNVPGPELIADAENGVIESPFFKATLDAERGRIVSLIDKRTGQEMVDADAPQGFGQYLYERFSYKEISEWLAKSLYGQYMAHRFCFAAYDMPQDTHYESGLPENMSLSIEKSTIDVKAVMTGTLPGPGQPQKVSIALTLSGFEPTADIEVSWQKQPDSWPEAGWICLPFKVDNQKFRLGRLGASVDPEKDLLVENVNYHLWCVNHGAAVYDAETGAGYGICSPDTPMVSLGEPGEYKFDKRFTPRKPYIYLNLYNNHWRTNFVAWVGDGRRMSAKVRLWAFEKFDEEGSLFTPALETRVPLQAAASKVQGGQLPATQSGIGLSRRGIALTAFGPNPDGEGTILRLWEQGGRSGPCTVTLPAGLNVSTIQPVNLRGITFDNEIPVKDGQFIFELNAYAPASFLIHSP